MTHFALTLIRYGFSGIEHKVDHHGSATRSEGSGSARSNESFYRFARREMPGIFSEVLDKELLRLERLGLL